MLTSTLKSALTDEENTQKTHFFTKITHLKSKNAQKAHLNALLNTENAHINKKHTINALLSALNVCFGKKCIFIWQGWVLEDFSQFQCKLFHRGQLACSKLTTGKMWVVSELQVV